MTVEFTRWPDALAARYREKGYWQDLPLTEILTRHAGSDAIAVIDGDHQISYRQLNHYVDNLAASLQHKGLKRGETALVQLGNIAEFYITLFALLKIGVAPVNALFSHQRSELNAYAEQIAPAALIADRSHTLFGDDSFLNAFCEQHRSLRMVLLRKGEGEHALEAAIARLLLFNDETFQHAPGGDIALESVSQQSWRRQPALPEAMYQLLSGAHYRTSPLDLRRMMDAPGQHFTCARSGNRIAGALWLVEEGGLEPSLSQAVWAGYRRPRGNLVAQSLAAHGGSPLAATLTGLRISRIAVHPARQREGLGQRLVAQAASQGAERDYLSVSFGYTPELWRFWQRCGFTLVRLGTHREASSGCYTAMALYPLSEAGQRLASEESARLLRDEFWLRDWRDEPSPLPERKATILSEEDWLEVAGFAFAHRPLLTSAGSLNRLLIRVDLPLPALRARLQQQDETAVCRKLGLSGRKALLVRLREEAAQALSGVNADRANDLRQQVQMLQFF